MDLSIRIRIIYNVKHVYAILLKFGGKLLTFVTKQVLEVKASICSTIKENPLLYCLKFLALVVVVIIEHIFITRFYQKPLTLQLSDQRSKVGTEWCSFHFRYRNSLLAWYKSGTRTPGPGTLETWDPGPGTRDPPQSLKWDPRTHFKV